MDLIIDHDATGGLRAALARTHDAASLKIDAFQHFPIVLGRLEQLKSAFALSPKPALALEFGVFTGGSLRALALANRKTPFVGFDSFEGLPEAWPRSEGSVYEAGHFAVDAPPAMPPNVTLVAGFFEDTLGPWLTANPGPIGFVHVDADLYSAARLVLDSLADRLCDGAVIVFDELGDWVGEGVYAAWDQGEWKALGEWLQETGMTFRILSRGPRFEAAIQVFRDPPADRSDTDDLAHAMRLWDQGARVQAVTLLEEVVRVRPTWLGGAYRLALWQTRLRRTNEALGTIAHAWPAAERTPDHNHAVELYRLRAECRMRQGELDAAIIDADSFRQRRPDHVSGLCLYANIQSRRKNHEPSAEAWTRAYQISGNATYRDAAESEAILSEIRPEFRKMKLSGLMIQHLVDERQFSTVLDIGSGSGEQAAALRERGKSVTELDYGESLYFRNRSTADDSIVGDFLQVEFDAPFDCVLASHVLEHQLNVNAFLRKVHRSVREGGVVAISVPPLKHEIVGGHVSLWNAGLVLYNLVLAGFDCRRPWIRRYGYNVSVVIEKRTVEPAGLVFDSGDIDHISPYLPEGFSEGFNGDIRRFG